MKNLDLPHNNKYFLFYNNIYINYKINDKFYNT